MSDGKASSAAEQVTPSGSLTDLAEEYRRTRAEVESSILPLATTPACTCSQSTWPSLPGTKLRLPVNWPWPVKLPLPGMCWSQALPLCSLPAWPHLLPGHAP